MSTDRQKSFIGTLSCEGRQVFIDTLRQEGRGTYSRLTAVAGANPTTFYFRWERDTYVMYVRNQSHIGKLVNLNSHGELAVSPREEAQNIRVDLDGQTLDDFTQNSINVNMRVNGKLITVEGTSDSSLLSGYLPLPARLYFQSQKYEGFAYFTINILERNAPYLSEPDEV